MVRAETKRGKGWCAPIEIGEAAAHYVSFVLPLDDRGHFVPHYTCETVSANAGARRIQSLELVKHGEDSFVLRIGSIELWFAARPVSRGERLAYVGELKHDNLNHLLVEIEPEEPANLDRLFESDRTIVIGCDPFAHYEGIERVSHAGG